MEKIALLFLFFYRRCWCLSAFGRLSPTTYGIMLAGDNLPKADKGGKETSPRPGGHPSPYRVARQAPWSGDGLRLFESKTRRGVRSYLPMLYALPTTILFAISINGKNSFTFFVFIHKLIRKLFNSRHRKKPG
jgi:hypothetical protein